MRQKRRSRSSLLTENRPPSWRNVPVLKLSINSRSCGIVATNGIQYIVSKWTEQLARAGCNLLRSNCQSKNQCCGGNLQDCHQKDIWNMDKSFLLSSFDQNKAKRLSLTILSQLFLLGRYCSHGRKASREWTEGVEQGQITKLNVGKINSVTINPVVRSHDSTRLYASPSNESQASYVKSRFWKTLYLAHSCARMRKQWMSMVGVKCRRKWF